MTFVLLLTFVQKNHICLHISTLDKLISLISLARISYIIGTIFSFEKCSFQQVSWIRWVLIVAAATAQPKSNISSYSINILAHLLAMDHIIKPMMEWLAHTLKYCISTNFLCGKKIQDECNVLYWIFAGTHIGVIIMYGPPSYH